MHKICIPLPSSDLSFLSRVCSCDSSLRAKRGKWHRRAQELVEVVGATMFCGSNTSGRNWRSSQSGDRHCQSVNGLIERKVINQQLPTRRISFLTFTMRIDSDHRLTRWRRRTKELVEGSRVSDRYTQHHKAMSGCVKRLRELTCLAGC